MSDSTQSESEWKHVWNQFAGREADVDVFDELEQFPGWEIQSRSTKSERDVVVVGVDGDETWIRFVEADMEENDDYEWVPEKRIKCDSCDNHEYPPDLTLFNDKCEECADMTREEAERAIFG